MYKAMYGDVPTPESLVSQIIGLIPNSALVDGSTVYMEAGAGDGRISRKLIERIAEVDPSQRNSLHTRLHLSEVQARHRKTIREVMDPAVVLVSDFLSVEGAFDVVFGNPPYNAGGSIKVPTNSQLSKKKDGTAVWKAFVKHSVSILKPGGWMVFLMPSIWLKPDNAGMYLLLTTFAIEKLIGFSASETYKLFQGAAQTPLTLVRLRKCSPRPTIDIYDTLCNAYVPYAHRIPQPIPLKCPAILQKVRAGLCTTQIGLPITRTNSAPKNTVLSGTRTNTCIHRNIRTCLLTKGKPRLAFEWSDRSLSFSGDVKLVLPHKMYGMPYVDATGQLGISRRDIYVIKGSLPALASYHKFLCSKLILYLYDATRYRMRFLERYIFQLLPNPTKLATLSTEYDDDALYEYFNLTPEEIIEVEMRAPNHLHFEY